MSKKDSPLTWTIESILAEARADQSNVNGRSPRKWGRVKGGLEIHIQFVGKNVFRLGLARPDKEPWGVIQENKYPSTQEWETVMAYWPEENTNVTRVPVPTTTEGPLYFWLVGELTVVRQLEFF